MKNFFAWLWSLFQQPKHPRHMLLEAAKEIEDETSYDFSPSHLNHIYKCLFKKVLSDKDHYILNDIVNVSNRELGIEWKDTYTAFMLMKIPLYKMGVLITITQNNDERASGRYGCIKVSRQSVIEALKRLQ